MISKMKTKFKEVLKRHINSCDARAVQILLELATDDWADVCVLILETLEEMTKQFENGVYKYCDITITEDQLTSFIKDITDIIDT